MNSEPLPFTYSAPSSAEAEQRSQVLSNLLNVSTYLVSVLDPATLLNGLVERVVDVVPAIQASILWLYEQQLGALRVVSQHGLEVAEIVDMQLRPGEGAVGITMKRGEAMLLGSRSIYQDAHAAISGRNRPGFDQLLNALPRELTAVTLPLRIGNETIGVLELINLGQSPSLHSQDLQVLQTFANLAAGAIKNAQLHTQMQSHQRRLEVFSAIGTAISAAADLDELVSNVLDVLLSYVRSPAGGLRLFNLERQVLTLKEHRAMPEGYAEQFREMPVAGAPTEDAVRYGQPMRRILVPEGEEAMLLAEGWQAAMYLPLLAGGTVVGVVCIYGDPTMLERVDVQTLMTVGSMIGFAIANVVLYQDSETERRRLRAVINSIAEGVALVDGQGRLVLANQTAIELLTLERLPYHQTLSEMPDFYAMRDIDGQQLTVERSPLSMAFSGGVFHDYRVVIQGASGSETVLSFSGAPVLRDDMTPDGAVVVFRDITVSQKLERAKDDFLAVAAHELRSPLAAIRSYSDFLLRRAQKRNEEDSPDIRGLTILDQQVSYMLRLVDNLLDVSRIEANQFNLDIQPLDLVGLVQQVIDQQRPSAGEHALVFSSSQEEIELIGDPIRLKQIITNMVSNAVRYSPNGSAVRVTTSLESVGSLLADHSEFATALRAHSRQVDEHDQMALIAVQDRGQGIAEDQRSNLFRRYVRGQNTKRTTGLGLGLYLTREFVVRHGGIIWVESKLNEGSTFFVALPLAQPDALI